MAADEMTGSLICSRTFTFYGIESQVSLRRIQIQNYALRSFDAKNKAEILSIAYSRFDRNGIRIHGCALADSHTLLFEEVALIRRKFPFRPGREEGSKPVA